MIKIRELRKMRGMTAKQLGSVLNVAESTISLYENGKRAPDYEMLKKISSYFGVSVDYLLDNDEPKEQLESSPISIFGDRIKQLRIEQGLTQKEMSDKLHVSPSAIGMYEQNRREPDANTLIKISEQFNVSTDYLLGNSKEKESSVTLLSSKFGTLIKQAREQKGISQKEFAEKIGVPANTLCQWETGKREPDYQMLKKIADILEVSTDYLLGREENEIFPSFNELRSNTPYVKKTTPRFTTASDQQDREFIEQYSKLTPEERKIILDLMKNFASNKT